MNKKILFSVSLIVPLCSCTGIKFVNWKEHDEFFSTHTWTKWETEDKSFVWYVEGNTNTLQGTAFLDFDLSKPYFIMQRTNKSNPNQICLENNNQSFYYEKKIDINKPNEFQIKLVDDFITIFAKKIVENEIDARFFLYTTIINNEQDMTFKFNKRCTYIGTNSTIFESKNKNISLSFGDLHSFEFVENNIKTSGTYSSTYEKITLSFDEPIRNNISELVFDIF